MDFFIVSVILLKVNKDDCAASDIQAETFDGHADTFGCHADVSDCHADVSDCHADVSDCHVEAFEAIIICCFIFMGFIVLGSFL
jgi:hypothetical protein